MELRGVLLRCSLFFFQAEDGIRDIGVTGVQTCALPIYKYISYNLVVYSCRVQHEKYHDRKYYSRTQIWLTQQKPYKGKCIHHQDKQGLQVVDIFFIFINYVGI